MIIKRWYARKIAPQHYGGKAFETTDFGAEFQEEVVLTEDPIENANIIRNMSNDLYRMANTAVEDDIKAHIQAHYRTKIQEKRVDEKPIEPPVKRIGQRPKDEIDQLSHLDQDHYEDAGALPDHLIDGGQSD